MSFRIFRQHKGKWIVFCLLLALANWLYGNPLTALVHGLRLRSSILAALSSAKQVRVTEHSGPADSRPHSETYEPNKIYKTINLSEEQIAMLKNALPKAPDYGRGTKCIFNDHHRIEAFQPGGGVFTLEICFECAEMKIDHGEKRIMPSGWNDSLARFIQEIGMTQHGPWPKDDDSRPPAADSSD